GTRTGRSQIRSASRSSRCGSFATRSATGSWGCCETSGCSASPSNLRHVERSESDDCRDAGGLMRDLRAALVGEALGTFLLVLFGTGSVACAVLTGALQGLWQVAVVWGFGVTIAIYSSAGLSGAHLNPAVSLAF